MRHAILDKLADHLASGVTREADVVYLLVEIGKYLEARPGESTFAEAAACPLLRFYRNWVAHAQIGNTKPADPLAAVLDDACRSWLVSGDLASARAMVDTAVSPERLRLELDGFLAVHRLDRDLVQSKDRWIMFLTSLVAVLTDVPLVFTGFTYLETFLFTEADGPLVWRVQAQGRCFEDSVRWS